MTRSIGSPLILTVFKTIDKTQPVLPKIVAPQLSLGNESNDIFFLIFSVIRHVALNTVEEQFFLPSDRPYAAVKEELGKLAVENSNGQA